MTMPYRLIQGDSRQVMSTLPDQSVHCIVTSPPYYGLRDYGVDGQIGNEKSLGEYITTIRSVFHQCWRVLRDDGTLWLNLGDSYANDTKWGGATGGKHATGLHGTSAIGRGRTKTGLPSKCLMGVPWRVALALVDDGWVLRSDIIWHKTNPLPESVTDRPTKAHEYLFLLTKGPRYYYDAEAISEPASPDYDNRAFTTERFASGRAHLSPIGTKERQRVERRNKRSVWSVPTHPYPDAHFATFPPDLIKPCILAGTSAHGVCCQCGAPWKRAMKKSFVAQPGVKDPTKRGRKGMDASNGWGDTQRGVTARETVGWEPDCPCSADIMPATILDPFNGSGTTGAVACAQGRHYVGIDLNSEYIDLAHTHIREAIIASGQAFIQPTRPDANLGELPLFSTT